MFKVLIAEDEPPIMRMIKSTLESVDSDFKVTECCINGKNAVEKLKNEDFDIVITDIKMPIMTGIELAGWIYQNKPDTKVIIVSGYSDFEYARKALEYKVFDYLLKPISKDKVSELTQRIKSEIADKNKMFEENNTIVILACAGAYLLYGSEVLLPGERFWSDSGIDAFMDNLLTTSEEYIFFNSNMLSERLMVITAETEERQEELIHKIYDEFSTKNLPMTIVYQKGVLFKDTGKYFSKLREQLIKHLILNKSQLLCCNSLSDSYEDISQPYSKADVDSIVFAIKNRNNDELKNKLIAVMNNMMSSDCTQEEINGFLNIILDTYTLNYPNHMKRKNTSVKKEFVNALASFVSYDAFIADIITLRNDKRDPDRYEQLANEVEEYLINNYNKNITSDVLSKEFGFVPSYISRLFKRQKGVSPNEYVTKYRIEKAKKLIEENNDLRIKDIADAVGFKESYYFSKTFKRETGMWPTEYSARDK